MCENLSLLVPYFWLYQWHLSAHYRLAPLAAAWLAQLLVQLWVKLWQNVIVTVKQDRLCSTY